MMWAHRFADMMPFQKGLRWGGPWQLVQTSEEKAQWRRPVETPVGLRSEHGPFVNRDARKARR